VTDDGGRLSALKLSSGTHNLRIRATGFKEASTAITAVQRGEISVRLIRTTDQAELVFQRAENARETARDDPGRQAAADLYRQALKLRPAYPAAHVGLARVLSDLNDTNGALAEIEAARAARTVYPEASAVEGRIFRETGQTDEAIGAFNRAIREAHGFQPEAHVGIGRVYEDKGEYELAAREFKIAVDQLFDTEPIIYQLLGSLRKDRQESRSDCGIRELSAAGPERFDGPGRAIDCRAIEIAALIHGCQKPDCAVWRGQLLGDSCPPSRSGF
jgi:tetratricopeptide (TPR) repeat protein